MGGGRGSGWRVRAQAEDAGPGADHAGADVGAEYAGAEYAGADVGADVGAEYAGAARGCKVG